MDITSLDYNYNVLAAAAFCHFSTFDVVHKVSGKFAFLLYTISLKFRCFIWWACACPGFLSLFSLSGLTWDSVHPCFQWMTPYMDTLRSEATPQLKTFPKVKADDGHNIQTHVTYLDLLVSRTHFCSSQSLFSFFYPHPTFSFLLFLATHPSSFLPACFILFHVCLIFTSCFPVSFSNVYS